MFQNLNLVLNICIEDRKLNVLCTRYSTPNNAMEVNMIPDLDEIQIVRVYICLDSKFEL